MDIVLKQFLKSTKPYCHSIGKIMLFGSRARGKEKPYSDYDLLILVRKKDRTMIDHLYDGVVDCLTKYGKLISLKIFTETEWDYLISLKTPFSQAVCREGVPLG